MANPQLWCGGPAHIFVGLGAANTPVYFGTTQGAPRFQHIKAFNDVMNDWAGDKVTFDKQYVGQYGMVTGDFSRFNNAYFDQMMSVPNYTGTPGLNPGGDLGTFMIQEGFAFPLWLQQPYATAKTAMNGLEAALHYFAAWLVGPDSKTVGTRTQLAHCVWFCHPIYTVDTNNTVREKLYDFSANGLPAIT